MVTAIYLCTSYDLLVGCAISWESCHVYFLYIVCCSIVAILVDIHSQWLIKKSLLELVVTYIEVHIFIHSLSIHHIFIYIIKFYVVSYS